MPGRTRGPGSESPFRAVAGGVEVRVRVTPKGGRDLIEGADRLDDGREVLKVRVRSLPEAGAANEAVRRLLAQALGRPASAVSLRSGAAARVKTFQVLGETETLAATLAALTRKDA